ncbi:MAG TPA: ImmA/IrrE family metallo-endopeptidase [Bacillota bacterium]|nr:ImmA/IrrE family metallo-endopeptidase [Bacillota bacterium]
MEEKIITIVKKLKKAFNNFNQDRIITDLEASIEKFGIIVRYSGLEDEVSGYSYVNDAGHPVIVVNGNHPKNRRRFTMAHELGHAILHWKWLNKEGQKLDKHLGEILYRSNSHNYINSKRERQANMFAAELLAPLDDVKEMLDGDKYRDLNMAKKLELEKSVSEKYIVSQITARIQLEKTDRLLTETE